MDNVVELRNGLIANMQASLKFVRQLLDLNGQEIAEIIGVTRQTINNLENNKSTMSPTQYIAICAVIDEKCAGNVDMLRAVNAVIQANAVYEVDKQFFHLYNGQFLSKWFSTFPTKDELVPCQIMNWETLDDILLQNLAENYKIFVSDDILMLPSTVGFFKRFAVTLQNVQNNLIIPYRVVEKLKALSTHKDDSVMDQANEGLRCIALLQSQGVVQIRGEQTDAQDMQTLFRDLFMHYSGQYKLALLTQNRELAQSIMQQTGSGLPRLSCKVNEAGELEKWISKEIGNPEVNTEMKMDMDSDMTEDRSKTTGWEIL